MPKNIKSSLKLYADDALLYWTIHSSIDIKILQDDIDTLQQWADLWLMKFNPQNCEYLRVTNKLIPFHLVII